MQGVQFSSVAMTVKELQCEAQSRITTNNKNNEDPALINNLVETSTKSHIYK